MKTNDIYLWIVVFLSITLGFLIGTNQQLLFNHGISKPVGEQKLQQFLYYLNEYYVDQVDADSLATEVIQEIIDELDPHSFYISSEDLQRISDDMQGNFVGIGVSFFMVNDTVNVTRVLQGGPGKKQGLKTGDRILVADKDTLYGKTFTSEAIVQRLRGEKETEVNLKLYRPSEKREFTIRLKRGSVPIRSVMHYMINDDVGYLKINRFAATTTQEFREAMQALIAKGMNELILDLRDNPGGLLESAISISDAFLEEGKTIVEVESNQGERTLTASTKKGLFKKGKISVLINRSSASASEIVAGALQDNDRAWIIGRRSFGKGLVQQQMPLGNNEAIRLTTARYYTPTGRSIQRPFLKDKQTYFAEIDDRFSSGEMASEEAIPKNDSLVFFTPQGRKVYGGGGITPDYYLTSSSTLDDEWTAYVLKSNVLNHFVYTELDKNRQPYSNFEQEAFVSKNLPKADHWVAELKKYIEQQGIPLSLENTSILENAIQGYMGLQLFNEEAQLEILNKKDPFVKAALSFDQGEN